jgi:hypothetical protein
LSFINAGPSPAWLGVVAAITFGGLVAAAFASGYHLASDAPRGSDLGSAASDSRSASSGAGEDTAAFAPIPGRIAEPLVDDERSGLMKAPGESEVLDELPPGQHLSISRESGDFLFVRYERDGKEHEGWAHRINVEREEP